MSSFSDIQKKQIQAYKAKSPVIDNNMINDFINKVQIQLVILILKLLLMRCQYIMVKDLICKCHFNILCIFKIIKMKN